MIVFVVILSAISSVLILNCLIPWLKRYFLDLPNLRSSHYSPIPRGGGLIFVLLSSLSCILYLFEGSPQTILFIPLVLVPLAIVGLFDDKYDLPPLWRYLFQIFSSFLLLWLSPLVSFQFFSSSLSGFLFILFVIFLLVLVSAIINFVNFMDGLNGLVAGCMFIAFSTLCIRLHAPWPFWVLVGSLLGFLFLNWSPSCIFMGDIGSTFLGALYAGLVLQSPNWSTTLSLLLVITPLLADSLSCILLRLYRRQCIFIPHRVHLYQRLNQAGFSHSFVSSIYIFATFLLSCSLIFGGLSLISTVSVLVIFAGYLLDRFFAVPFSLSIGR